MRVLLFAAAAGLLIQGSQTAARSVPLSAWDPSDAQVFGSELVAHAQLPLPWQELTDAELASWASRLLAVAEAHSSIGESAEALVTYRQCAALAWRFADKRLLNAAFNGAGVVCRQCGLLTEAQQYYEHALQALEDIEEPQAEAVTLDNIGMLYAELGNPGEALTCHKRAAALHRAAQDGAGEAKALRLAGEAYLQLDSDAQAEEQLLRALALSRAHGDRFGEGHALSVLGTLYDARGFYEKSLECHAGALAAFREAGGFADQAAALHNIGELNRMLGRFPVALDYLGQSLVISRELGDASLIGATLNGLGNAHYLMGHYEIALQHFEEAMAVKREVGDERAIGLASNSIGLVYHSAGLHERALEYYREALARQRACGAAVDQATTLANIASVHRMRGEYEQATAMYQQALVLSRQAGIRQVEGVTLNNLGTLQRLLGYPQEALVLHQEALSISLELGDLDAEATALGNIGVTYILLGQPTQALDPLAQALALARQSEDVLEQWHALHHTGWAHAQAGDYGAALPPLEQALATACGQARQFTWESGLKETIVEELSITGALLARVQLALGDVEGAFVTAQTVKGVPLLQLLLQSRLRVEDSLSQQALDRYRDAQAALERYRHDLASVPDTAVERREELETRIAQQEAAANDAWDYLREHESRLVDIAEIKGLTAAQVQQEVLRHGQTALEYLVAQPLGEAMPAELVVFVLPAEGELTVVQQPLPEFEGQSEFDEWIRQEVWWLLGPIPDKRREAARALYDLLVEPVVDAIPAGDNLIICPDRSLFVIPFEALVDRNDTCVLERSAVSYATSVTTLSYLQGGRAAQGALVVGVSFADGADPLQGLTALTSLSALRGGLLSAADLRPLPGVRTETDQVAALLGVQPVLDEAATEPEVRRMLPGRELVHLATHGFLTSSPLLNGIVLFYDPAADTCSEATEPSVHERDGLLTMAEVMGLDLRGCKLVTLSCCHSAQGETDPGAGVMGISQGFMYAGAQGVLASLTTVDDEATQKLMIEFYRRWREEGMGKAAALRESKLSLQASEQYAAPQFWAAFVLYGAE